MRLPTINFGGLASGLDTNSIVQQLMAIERNPHVRLQQQQRVEEARQTALRDVNTRLLNLKTAAASLRDAGTWGDVQTVEASDPTKLAVTRIGGAAPGGYAIGIAQLARAHQVGQTTALASAAADDVLHVQVGAGATVDVAVTAGDTLQTIADRLNQTSGIGTYATVVNDRLVLSGKTTGAANTISVTSDGSLAADLGFAQTLAAQDASFTVDGVARTSASNTVTDAVVGLSITLKAQTTTDVAVNVGTPGPDSAKVQERIKAFVDQYNSTVDFIRGKLAEKRVPNATNDADRAKGVLFNDTGLAQLLGRLRSSIGDVFSGASSAYDQLSEVGLSTGAASATGTPSADSIAGKLSLDATKLTNALTANFNGVKELFTKVTGDYASEGLGQRLDRLIGTYTNADGGLISSRLAAAQSQIDFLKQRQADMDIRLERKEIALRRQFTAMESALSNAQSQGQWLSGQIAGLQ